MKPIPREENAEKPSSGRGRGVYYSMLLHILLVLIVFVGVDWTTHREAPMPAGESQVMQATAVDAGAVAREMNKLKAAENAKQRAAEQQVKESLQRQKNEEKALEKLKVEKENLKRETAAEAQHLQAQREQLAQEKAHAVAEQKKLDEKRKADDLKQTLAKKQADAQKAQEDAKTKAVEKKKQEAADAKKKAADDKHKAEDAKKLAESKRQAAEAKALADELANEESELAAAAQGRQDQSQLARFTAAILRQVSNNFVAPDFKSGLKCTLLVRMIPGGEVVDARVVKSSGNPTFDRQAELAVRKASPLPVPDEPRLFQQMKEIQFEFDPSEGP
jgi:colicin import membrane protein